jgi:hypothetical protein
VARPRVRVVRQGGSVHRGWRRVHILRGVRDGLRMHRG